MSCKTLLLLATALLVQSCTSTTKTTIAQTTLSNPRTPAATDQQVPRTADQSAQPAIDVTQAMLTPSKAPLFSDTGFVNLKLTGEFDRIHKANAGGNWTGEERTDPQYWTDGTIIDKASPNQVLKHKTRARGMSSADDVSFPKMRVEIDDTQKLKGTSFKDARNFRINAHNNTDPDPEKTFTSAGRLNDERSPIREALAYDIARAMDLAAPATRRAIIDYTDTGLKKSFTRKALLIETDKKIAERTGTTVSLTFPWTDKIPVRIGARFHFFNILIGNDDIGLKLKNELSTSTEIYRPYFNTTVFDLPDGTQFPIVYDFDYASIVTGDVARNWGELDKNFPMKTARGQHVLRSLALLRSRLSLAEYQQAVTDYKQRRAKILDTIKRADVDEEGRQGALAHVANLDEAIVALEGVQMLLKNEVRFFADPKGEEDLVKRKEINDQDGSLKPGVLVRVLDSSGDMVKVAIFDIRRNLKDNLKNVGYIKKSDLVLGFDLPTELQGVLDEREMMFE